MVRKKITAGRENTFGPAASPIRNVIPDRLDLRDRVYLPPVAVVPGLTLVPKTQHPCAQSETDQRLYRFRAGKRRVSVAAHSETQADRLLRGPIYVVFDGTAL